MYSGPSCFSNRLDNAAISFAVYSDMRCSGSSNGLAVAPLALCWSPELELLSFGVIAIDGV